MFRDPSRRFSFDRRQALSASHGVDTVTTASLQSTGLSFHFPYGIEGRDPMMKHIGGVYAAVLTPRRADDSVDAPALRGLLSFLLELGVSGLALNGATGEFCLSTPAQLDEVLKIARDAVGQDGHILCGIGAAGAHGAIALAGVAESHGVQGLLLPMPFFFPYQQEDLDAFCRTVAASTSLPVLLYNLPQFTSGLAKETVHQLIVEVPNIIGIKDSSGSLDILQHLTDEAVDAIRIVGNDSALAPALRDGVCDGVVSGVACVLPELILSLFENGSEPSSDAFEQQSLLLIEFIEQLGPFPTPWGLKWVAQARGLLTASFAQPVTGHRREQADALMTWFAQWHRAVMVAIPTAGSTHTQAS
jgi:4-hydroxy-tetrahydrodipicolinate synthase